jgi:glycosyltransferase involved in cell wall biosynthesis
MAESRQEDVARRRLRELTKTAIVSQFDASLAGGTPQARYIEQLGVSGRCVFTPYDVVDNELFATKAATVRENPDFYRGLLGLSRDRPFLLASGRFIVRKNYDGLIRGYRQYRDRNPGRALLDLVLVGDGPTRGNLVRLVDALGLSPWVTLTGYRQEAEVAAYYGLADAFIHPATSEQWGLVINEAMAAGLPVLVSARVGAVEDLVTHEWNGFTFDPDDPSSIADSIARVPSDHSTRLAMGTRSAQRVAAWSLARFAEGLWDAVAAGAETAGRGLPHRVRAVVWASQVVPQQILRWQSVEE